MTTFTISKDKNFLMLQDNTKTAPYKFDINTGIFYGLREKPIQKYPAGFPTWLKKNYYTNGILFLMHCIRTSPSRYDIDGDINTPNIFVQCANLFRIVDKLNSINYRPLNYNNSEFDKDSLTFIDDNFKDFSKYVRENGDRASLWDYKRKNEKILWAKKHNLKPDDYITTDIINMLYNNRTYYDDTKIPYILSYIRRGLLDWFNGWNDEWSAFSKVSSYFNMCEVMEKEPEKGDFFRLYINTYREYQLAKTEIDTRAIQKNLAKHPALAFENDDFKVVIPKDVQDFKAEADAMHNCVYSMYMNRVVNGSTNVVFVRMKNDIDTPYITCEVNNSGRIVQYLASYNRSVQDVNASEFRTAYQSHLWNNWL